MKRLCFLSVVLCLLGGTAFAAFEWINSTSGYWSDAANWRAADGSNRVPDGQDEIKIREEGETILNTVEDNNSARLRLYNGTMTITTGAHLTIGWTRIGHTNAQTAIINQDGGIFDHQDGRLSLGNDYATGIWNISGGTLSSTASGMYIGYTRTSGYAASTGRLVSIGSNATIMIDEMRLGLGTVAAGDTGILEFQLDAGGASEITITESLELDVSGENSNAYLELSAIETPTVGDIVLVHISSGNPITGSGVFDAMNGGSAAEGEPIVLGDNIYSLTYQYDADGDSANNDIALVFVSGLGDRAYDPKPAHRSETVPTSLTELDWTNPDPNTPGYSITCDVYLGTEPNKLLMDVVTLGADESSVALNAENFPNILPLGMLENNVWYHWIVDCHDPSLGEPPDDLIPGAMWEFYTDDNDPPVVDAGEDQVVWLGMSGTPGEEVVFLGGTTSDDGLPEDPGELMVEWTHPELTIAPHPQDPDNPNKASVTVTEPGTYVFTLTAHDGEKGTPDTVEIIVGANACDASHRSTGDDYNPADQNEDCIVDLEDFVAIIAVNWLDCTDVLTHCGN